VCVCAGVFVYWRCLALVQIDNRGDRRRVWNGEGEEGLQGIAQPACDGSGRTRCYSAGGAEMEGSGQHSGSATVIHDSARKRQSGCAGGSCLLWAAASPSLGGGVVGGWWW